MHAATAATPSSAYRHAGIQQQQHDTTRRRRRTPRDMQDYPIFLTGNPPDLVRLAIEFGHVPFVDHLLHRGFRPRDLPEYFSLIPFLTPPSPSSEDLIQQPSTTATTSSKTRTQRGEVAEVLGDGIEDDQAASGGADRQWTSSSESREQIERRNQYAALVKRSLELNQIWECMKLASQELMDACSRADLDAVLKVLDATLVRPRLSLEESAAAEAAAAASYNMDRQVGTNAEDGRDRYGKRRKSSLDPVQSRHDSIGTGSEARFLGDDQSLEMSGAGVGTSSSHRPSAATIPLRDRILEDADADEVPLPSVIHRSSLFRPRSRTNSDGGCTSSSDEDQQHRMSVVRSTSDTFSGSDTDDQPPHMPWIDGRALTSALLAVCFRRDGYESPEAEIDEELRAVPIVRELLKYDCMLTAQSMGQAVLGVAYSRSAGSLKRTQEQRLMWRRQKLQPPSRRQDRGVGGSSSHSRQDSISQGAGGEATGAGGGVAGGGQGVGGLTESVMDLLLERIGPREWLKLIKCYLQRQEFDDLFVVLERCPFKGPQLETRNKDQDKAQRPYSGGVHGGFGTSRPGGYPGRGGGTGSGIFSTHQGDYDRQRAREMICREAGICGVGSRISHFNGRGVGQAFYNVSSTLYDSSQVLFTGSGTRFSHSYMLPRAGFRGIGSNSSGHSGSPNHSNISQVVGSTEMDDESETYQQNQTSSTSDHDQQQQPSRDAGGSGDRGGGVGSSQKSKNNTIESDDYDDGGPIDDYDDHASNTEQPVESHDSNFAFGGVGSSTTSSSRPGPGIVGIAIQVQAPEHILNALLKMGFRFFSICDLSISDGRHPLALQFRQQEKMNRQLIEFCMVPNLERLGEGQGIGSGFGRVGVSSVSGNNGKGKARAKGKWRKFEKRDARRYDSADREAHAQTVQAFLYPAASNPTPGWSSNPALPSMVSSIDQRISGVSGGGAHSGPSSPVSFTASLLAEPPSPHSPAAAAAPSPTTTAGPSSLTPSNRLQFVLPPMQLGDSFESISTIIKFADDNPDLHSHSPPSPSNNNNYTNSPTQSTTLTQRRYRQSGVATSMPLPIRTSMVERRISGGSNFFAVHSSLQDGAAYHLSVAGSLSSSLASDVAAAVQFSNQQKMFHDTIRRRVREILRSDYMDLMTVGICLYQACYHEKEVLLTVLLEHRLLVAQDALTGAVQVAASVGWKRGLELLLVQCGDMEAEIEPVITTTSEYVHLGTSMKWDHATAVQVFPNGKREPGPGGRVGLPGSLGARRGARVAAAGGLEGLVTRGLRRHRSDSSRLDRFGYGGGFFGGGAPGDGIGGGGGRPSELNRRASFEASHLPPFHSTVFTSSPIEETPFAQSTLLGPVIPTVRSSSLRTRLSSLIPNLGVSSGSSTDLAQKLNSKNKQQTQQQSNSTGQPDSTLFTPNRNQRSDPPPTILMLSTSGLWSLPNVMMQRKSRNAVVALMAACTRNDPGLVMWLIETFADIKVVHIMQALMIACDRGLVRVVRALLGGPLVHQEGTEGVDSVAGKSRKNGGSATASTAATGTSRSLFRRWLAFQYQQIIDKIKQSSTVSSSNAPTGAGVAEQESEDQHSETTPVAAGPESEGGYPLPRFDSFPFVFLMESSPLFRHYYQTLNTLTSCQFMLKKSISVYAGARRTSLAPSQVHATAAGSLPNNNSSTQPSTENDGGSSNNSNLAAGATTSNSSSTATPTSTALNTPMNPLQRRASASSRPRLPSSPTTPLQQSHAGGPSITIPSKRSHHSRQATVVVVPPQEIKREIIRLMLGPILETFGPISVRKALDRLPKDCWWPLDHDVRMMVDQDARKDMVAVVMGMKRHQRENRQREQKHAARESRVENDTEEEEVYDLHHHHNHHGRHESRTLDLQHLSEQKKKDQKWRGKGKEEVEDVGGEREKKLSPTRERWHKASGPFRRVRKWVVERKKKNAAKDLLDVEAEEMEGGGGLERFGGFQDTVRVEKSRSFDLSTTRPGLVVVQ
ncbi:hypothetical protein BGX33_008014 [Mortierella sp. NVP41]|nr:hypothetical protein BGX33_008014 [Mortierella sp. NVP41]